MQPLPELFNILCAAVMVVSLGLSPNRVQKRLEFQTPKKLQQTGL